jgi:uncharacterized membrane protein YeiB
VVWVIVMARRLRPAAGSRRVSGIDLARALAIIGMVAVHISPWDTGVSGEFEVLAVPQGRSAILFGLLAGVGVSLLASSRTTSTSRARQILLWRTVVLLPLGLGLQLLDHEVYVILADYSLLFLVAMVVLRWSDRALLVLAGVSFTLGTVAYRLGQLAWPETFVLGPAAFGDPPGQILQSLVVSGPYPLITWLAPFAVGIWLGRRDLASPLVREHLMIVGGVLAALVPLMSWGIAMLAGGVDAGIGWWQLLEDAPHTQTPVWLLSATGSAVLVLGMSLWIADRRPRQLAPLVKAGQHAFTWYVAHLLVLHFQPSLLRHDTTLATLAAILGFTIVMGAGSMAWSTRFQRGPLEYTLRPPSRAPVHTPPSWTVVLLVAALVGGCTVPPSGERASDREPPWDARPIVDLSFDVADDLHSVRGRERIVFTPDLRVCELVFRAWPNKPTTASSGTSLVVTEAFVEGAPVAPVVTSAGAPADASGTLIELPLSSCVEPGESVEAELLFDLELGQDANERLGVAPAERVAWFAGGFPLLAWVRGEGWARDDAVGIVGETSTSEAFELATLTVTAAEEYAVLGTGSILNVEASDQAGRRVHRFAAAAVRDVAVSVGRYDVETQDINGVRISVGVPISGTKVPIEEWIEVHAETIDRIAELFGPFPYPDLWVTIAPSQTSGLEFPTALQYGDLRRDELSALVAHELAHQWTYALVGNNQARDPWIDEAFATFAQAVVTDTEHEFPLPDTADGVAGYLGYPMSYWAAEGGFDRLYEGVYRQGAAVLLAGRDRVGSGEFDAAVRTYLDVNAHQVAGPATVEAAFRDLPEVETLLRDYGAFSGPDA